MDHITFKNLHSPFSNMSSLTQKERTQDVIKFINVMTKKYKTKIDRKVLEELKVDYILKGIPMVVDTGLEIKGRQLIFNFE